METVGGEYAPSRRQARESPPAVTPSVPHRAELCVRLSAADVAARSLTCRIASIAQVHAYAQVSMFIRSRQSRQSYPAKILTP
jgi:hypothetical protein